MERIWVGRMAGSSPFSPSSRSNRQLRPGFQKRLLNEERARLACSRRSSAPLISSSCRSHCSNRQSALYQSALISTALPRRGVTTQSPTFASIQVSRSEEHTSELQSLAYLVCRL